jgi:very-short-patch-repair endonuclease
MDTLFIWLGVIVVAVLAFKYFQNPQDGKGGDFIKRGYQYKKKDFLLSRAEHECYDALVNAVGKEFYIFPQAHLSSIVDNKVVGQNWKAAFRHINGKSVDFVLCDKAYIAPRLAIELDDRTHERTDRQERDGEVERILNGAGLPLLRLDNHGQFNPSELSRKINVLIAKK